jgi:hypothetical protein
MEDAALSFRNLFVPAIKPEWGLPSLMQLGTFDLDSWIKNEWKVRQYWLILLNIGGEGRVFGL